MKISVARDGNLLGEFDLSELKRMAASSEIKMSDHVYVNKENQWAEISRVTQLCDIIFPGMSMFRGSESMIPPPPPPAPLSSDQMTVPPPPQPIIGTSTDQLIKGDVNVDEVVNGYPRSYWVAYFGEKSDWYINQIAGLPLPGEKYNANSFWDYARFPGWGLLLGWAWLAFRRLGKAYLLYGLCALVCAAIEMLTKDTRPSSSSYLWGYNYKYWMATISLFLVYPGFGGVHEIYKRACGIFEKVESLSQNPEERIELIRQEGGVSWLNLIGFLAFCYALNNMLLPAFVDLLNH